MSTLNKSSVIVAADHATSAEVDGESVILDLDDGIYYGLNSSGSRVWKEIQEQKTIQEVVDSLVSDYDIGREKCMEDVMDIVRELEECNLIHVYS